MERADLGDALIVPPRQLLNRAVRIVGHLRHADRTPFAMHVCEFPIEFVIETKDIRFALEINHARMVARRQCVAIHDVALELPGSAGVRAHGISDPLRTAVEA